jgi:myo-inositol catabolism protein IolH
LTAVTARSLNARVHQYNEIGHGDIDWDETFAALSDVNFDGIAAVCVFGREEDADAIHHRMLDRATSGLAGPAREPR